MVTRIRTPLFLPASRPDRFAKATASGADPVILYLEDAVAADDKDAARAALYSGFTDLTVILRVNGQSTPRHAEDGGSAARRR